MDTKVSVIMSVFNCEEYIEECIESVLNQTFTEFEFVIVDDASIDKTPDILKRYEKSDSRINIITNIINKERCYSRNLAIKNTHSEYIAVMDADDWAFPERLELQFKFMEHNPDIAVCGSQLQVYETGEIWRAPEKNDDIRASLLFNSCIYHPSAFFRKRIVEDVGRYDESKPRAEDYDLWCRLSANPEVKFYNIQKPLIRYRIHPNKKRSVYHKQLYDTANSIRRDMLARLGLVPSKKIFEAHLILGGAAMPSSSEDILQCLTWAKKLYDSNNIFGVFNRISFQKILNNHVKELFIREVKNDFSLIFAYKSVGEYSIISTVIVKMRMFFSFLKSILSWRIK